MARTASRPLEAASRPQPSLRARALRFLAQREHSRVELERKLSSQAGSAVELDQVLDQLQQQGLLCDRRFAQSLVHRRGGRLGMRRLAQELQAHGVEPESAEAALAPLHQSESERARQVWQKRFGVVPQDASERARQYRFMLQRGFDAELVTRLLRDCA